jgi:poly(hydroxyalkanoate) depolymerase family esterase
VKFQLPREIACATDLVRAGKVAEATAALRQALTGGWSPSTPPQAPEHPVARKAEAKVHVLYEERAPVLEPGRFVRRSYSNRAGMRTYKVYAPASFRGQALPVVVMLHGCTQNPDDFAAGTRMNQLADELGVVVVYPAQSSRANATKCWNWFQAAHQRRDEGEPSLIAGITREVLALGLDERRVYVAGLSAGGAMAAVMGATYPDLYAAIGVHSGLAHAVARDLPSALAAMSGKRTARHNRMARGEPSARTVPIIAFHGDQDTTVHPSNSDFAHAGDAQITTERGEHNGRSFTRTTQVDAKGNPMVEQWILHGAGHAWSGGSAGGSFTDPLGPDASREMLRFFLQHPL